MLDFILFDDLGNCFQLTEVFFAPQSVRHELAHHLVTAYSLAFLLRFLIEQVRLEDFALFLLIRESSRKDRAVRIISEGFSPGLARQTTLEQLHIQAIYSRVAFQNLI